MKVSLPGFISKIMTMSDGCVRLQVDTQEVLPEYMTEMFSLKNKMGWFIFHEKPITEIDTKELPEIKTEAQQKTPSKRLYSVLFVLWQQSNSDKTFDVFYFEQMESIINSIKVKLT